MSKMSINDAAQHFGVSKEAIHNRIRRGSLESVIEDGVKLVIVDANAPKRSVNKNRIAKATLNDERYYKLLEEQNAKLQSRVEILETETRSLRDQKEQMLIEERLKIETIYREKDEQLKNILSSISSKFMLGVPEPQNIIEEETLEAEIEEEEILKVPKVKVKAKAKVISLKKHLKKLKLTEKKQRKIYKKFKKREGEKRIIVKKDKYYLNTVKFSYDDIFQ